MQTQDRVAPHPYPDLTGAEDDIAREPLWYAFGLGRDRPAPVRSPLAVDRSAEDRSAEDRSAESSPADGPVADRLPATVARPLRTTPLPRHTVDLLETAPYPHGRLTGAGDDATRLGHALITALGLQRREPSNPFNDHRGHPSVRSKFPVHVIVGSGGRQHVVDVYRHALLELAAGRGDPRVRRVALAGQYTRLQPFYRWFRGSLVGLELGFNLRALCFALELFGIPGWLRLPDANATADLVGLGLVPTWEWTLPLSVELMPPADGAPGDGSVADGSVADGSVADGSVADGSVADGSPADGSPADGAPRTAGENPPDPVMAEVVAINRAQAFSGPATRINAAIPAGVSDRPLTWAELLWRRTSGGMPRGLHGTNGYRHQVPPETLRDSVAWATVPAPGPLLPAVFREVRSTMVVQGTDGFTDGIHRVAGGAVQLETADSGVATRLEEHYGYSLLPWRGCDVRHASALWFFSMRPRDVMSRFGAGGWTAAQYACGWAAQGICLAAAAHGLYARPVRAFREDPTRRVLGLPEDEMMVLAVIVGTPRQRPPALDLRP